MERPVAIGCLFVPAFRSDDVVASVAVQVPGTDSMSGSGIPQIALGPFDGVAGCEFVEDDGAADVGQEFRLSIPGEIHHFAGFHVSGQIDFVFLPCGGGSTAGVLHPPDSPAKIIAGDDIGAAIAIDVER